MQPRGDVDDVRDELVWLDVAAAFLAGESARERHVPERADGIAQDDGAAGAPVLAAAGTARGAAPPGSRYPLAA